MRLESFEEEDETIDTEPNQFINSLQSQLGKEVLGRRGSMPTHMLTGTRPDQRHNSVSQVDTQAAMLDPPKEGEIILYEMCFVLAVWQQYHESWKTQLVELLQLCFCDRMQTIRCHIRDWHRLFFISIALLYVL